MPGGDSTVISRIDGVMTSVAVKAPVAAVAVTPIQLKGLQTVNGVVLTATIPPARCLVTAQADATQNGIYDVSTTGWLRSTDFDGAYDAVQGTLVVVNALGVPPAAWQLTSANPVVFGTSAITFVQVGAAFPGLGSLVFALSNAAFAGNFTAIVAAAAAVNGSVLIDRAGFLTGHTSISANVGTIASIGAGAIALGNFNLTFNGTPVSALGVQVFSITGSGSVLGFMNCPVCIDWWGTTSASVADAATTNAGNAALTFATAAMAAQGQQTRVYCTKTIYYLSASWVKPSSSFCPEFDGQGADLIYNSIASGTAAIVVIGVSGNGSTGSVHHFLLNGSSTSWGIEVRGQCQMDIHHIRFQTNLWGLVLHNATTGQFTESVVVHDCIFSCSRAIWRKITSGMNSFRASGTIGNVIVNYQASTLDSPFLIDTGAYMYQAPITCNVNPNTNSFPIWKGTAGITSRWMTHGDFGVEGSATYTFLSGGSFEVYCHTGSVECFGGAFTNIPDLKDTTSILVDGVTRGRNKGKLISGNIAGPSTDVAVASATSKNYLLYVIINITNYYWAGVLVANADPFGGGAVAAIGTPTHGGGSFGSWGTPSFTWSGSVLNIANASFPASGTYSVATTDLGDFF